MTTHEIVKTVIELCSPHIEVRKVNYEEHFTIHGNIEMIQLIVFHNTGEAKHKLFFVQLYPKENFSLSVLIRKTKDILTAEFGVKFPKTHDSLINTQTLIQP